MDLLLLLFIGGYVYGGFRTGLVHQVISLGLLALAFVVGAYLRGPLNVFVAPLLKGIPTEYGEMVAYGIAFSAIFLVANLIVLRIFKHVPVRGVSAALDRVLGAILGGVVAVLVISAGIAIIDTYYKNPEFLGPAANTGMGFLKSIYDSLEVSTIAGILRATTVPVMLTILGPVIPRNVTLPYFPQLPVPI
ncbi:MAG: CvpA family protein [Candidatus Limnocylindrales bacterium]